MVEAPWLLSHQTDELLVKNGFYLFLVLEATSIDVIWFSHTIPPGIHHQRAEFFPRTHLASGEREGRVYACLFMWRARWSDREKHLSHWPHLKGFAPVCFRKWRVSSSERANRQPQPAQPQLYGFSPESCKTTSICVDARGALSRTYLRVYENTKFIRNGLPASLRSRRWDRLNCRENYRKEK